MTATQAGSAAGACVLHRLMGGGAAAPSGGLTCLNPTHHCVGSLWAREVESTTHRHPQTTACSSLLLLFDSRETAGEDNRRQGPGPPHAPEKFLVASMVVRMAPCQGEETGQRRCDLLPDAQA